MNIDKELLIKEQKLIYEYKQAEKDKQRQKLLDEWDQIESTVY